MRRWFALCLLLLASQVAFAAATVTPNESVVLQANPYKIGINLNGPAYYGAGQIYKNLDWRNPGFEGAFYRQKYATHVAGTTTTFVSNNPYDPVVANFWTGASFKLYSGASTSATPWCTGTIASNTVTPGGSNGPTYTFSSACPRAVAEADVIVLYRPTACTPEADWESGHAGWWGGVSGGGTLTSDCSTPYDGAQSIVMNASASGSYAGMTQYIDAQPSSILGLVMNGTFQVTGYMKKVSGSPVLNVSVGRNNVSSQTGNPLTCTAQNYTPTTSWTQFTFNCTGNETNALPGSEAVVQSFGVTGGTMELDNVTFQQTGTDPTNTTVFRDPVVNALKAHCAGASLSGVPCILRNWAGQNAETLANTTKNMYERASAVNAYNYDYSGGQGYPNILVGLQEYLQLCQQIGAIPYFLFPETTGRDESAAWIDYLKTNGWMTVFPKIEIAMGNENWNSGEGSGQGLGGRNDAPDYYFDYSQDAAGVFNTARADSNYNSSIIDFILGIQDGNPDYGVHEAIQRATPNAVEIAPYTQNYLGNASSIANLWQPLFTEVVTNVDGNLTTSTYKPVFYRQYTAAQGYGARVNVYEFDNGTGAVGSGITQANLDSFTAAAGYGTATALQSLQMMKAGILMQNFFSLDQSFTGIGGGLNVHQWGAMVDMNGASNTVRPQELGMRMANAAIIGPMYSCPVTSPDTYTQAANTNGYDNTGTNAASNVPYEFAYCFKQPSGSGRSMVLINADVANSHTVSLTGAQSPNGTVTVTKYAPASIGTSNEVGGTGYTGNYTPTVAISSPTTVTNPSSVTMPPYSITRLDWTTGATQPSAPTGFSGSFTLTGNGTIH